MLLQTIKGVTPKHLNELRYKLRLLYEAISNIENNKNKYGANITNIKRNRDDYFFEITSIYDKVFIEMSQKKELESFYETLLKINKDVVSALKFVSMGNNRLVSDSDGCICRNKMCVLPKCTEFCRQVCVTNARFTQYNCINPSTNETVISLDAVCNGKADCPYGDDEKNCNKGRNNYKF